MYGSNNATSTRCWSTRGRAPRWKASSRWPTTSRRHWPTAKSPSTPSPHPHWRDWRRFATRSGGTPPPSCRRMGRGSQSPPPTVARSSANSWCCAAAWPIRCHSTSWRASSERTSPAASARKRSTKWWRRSDVWRSSADLPRSPSRFWAERRAAGLLDVLFQLRDKRIHVVEADHATQPPGDLQSDPPSVQVGVEVEDVRFDAAVLTVERGIGSNRDGRHTQRRRFVGLPPVVEEHRAARIHAIGGDGGEPVETEVGRGKPELAAPVVAVLDDAVDAGRTPQCGHRQGHVTRLDAGPDVGRADDGVAVAHEVHHLDTEAELLGQVRELLGRPGGPVAEVKVRTDQHLGDVHVLDEHLAHELDRVELGDGAVERDNAHVVDAERGGELGPAPDRGKHRGMRPRPDELGGVQIECQ